MPLQPSIIGQVDTSGFDANKYIAENQQRQAASDERLLRLQQLANAKQQGQMGEIQLSEAKQGQTDDAAYRQTMTETGGDLEKAVPLLSQRVPKIAMAVRKQLEDYRDAQTKRKTGELELDRKKNEMAGEAFSRVWAATPDQRQQVYQQERDRAIQGALIKAEDAPEQYPGDDFIASHRFMGLAQDKVTSTILAERKAEDDRKKNEAELPGIQSDAARKVVVADSAQLAAIEDDVQRAKAIGALPPLRAKAFFNTDGNPKSLTEIQKMGQTANEQVTTGQAADTAAAVAEWRKKQQSNEDRQYGLNKRRVEVMEKGLPGSGGAGALTGDAYLKALEDEIPNGGGQELPSDVAAAILGLAGGDQAKALAIASRKGWK